MISNLISEEFERLKDKFSSIQHYQRLVAKNTENILEKLLNDEERNQNAPEIFKDIVGTSYDSFYYPAPCTGEPLIYSHKKTSIQEIIQLTYLVKNKQYQWLLSEAYEAFEDFIEMVYAHCGFVENDFWSMQHRKKLSQASDTSDIENFKIASKNISVFEILNRIRCKVPRIKNDENGHSIHGHLRFYLILIEKIRHVVVHVNGITADKEKFAKEILDKCNVSGNKEVEPIVRNMIEEYFGTEEYSNYINLLERNIKHPSGLPLNSNIQEKLINKMLTYAHLLITHLNSYFEPVNSDSQVRKSLSSGTLQG
ncbi:hypothetical protein ACO0LB_11120 [Undibacterium sp. SXout7W]|uniref:hypothetical protein n=1 Tax=Undibacterium sp. SXout7W TaxID=3413049 RepID=UPI003BF2438B